MTRVRLNLKTNKSSSKFLFGVKILSAVTSFILIPIVLKICGPELWMQVATLQTIAIILSPLIRLHWSKFGGLTLSQNQEVNHKRIILHSILSRLIVLILVNIIAIYLLYVYFNSENSGLLYSAFFFASTAALSNEWYFLAKSDFRGFLLMESIPRFVCTCAPVAFIQTVNQLTILFVSLAFVNIGTSLIILKNFKSNSTVSVIHEHSNKEKSKFIALQFLAFAILFSPVPIVNLFNFHDKFEFTIMERFFRLFMTAILPISQLAHSQILNAKNMLRVSREWYRKSKLLAIGILVLYFPSSFLFLLITSETELVVSRRLMFSLFGILILITFTNRIIEELFVLNLNRMALINSMQGFNILLLLSSFTFSIILRSSNALLIALILAELARFWLMKRKLILAGLID